MCRNSTNQNICQRQNFQPNKTKNKIVNDKSKLVRITIIVGGINCWLYIQSRWWLQMNLECSWNAQSPINNVSKRKKIRPLRYSKLDCLIIKQSFRLPQSNPSHA